MVDSINRLEELSSHIQTRLDMMDYEELSQLMERRQLIVDQVEADSRKRAFDASDKAKIAAILVQDEPILRRIEALRSEAADWLQQRQVAKHQRQAYEQTYAASPFLMDHKK